MSAGRSDVEAMIGAAQGWLKEASLGAHGGLATGSAECGVCPVCKLVSLVRDADPSIVTDVVERAASALTAIGVVLQSAADLLATVPPAASEVADETDDAASADDA